MKKRSCVWTKAVQGSRRSRLGLPPVVHGYGLASVSTNRNATLLEARNVSVIGLCSPAAAWRHSSPSDKMRPNTIGAANETEVALGTGYFSRALQRKVACPPFLSDWAF